MQDTCKGETCTSEMAMSARCSILAGGGLALGPSGILGSASNALGKVSPAFWHLTSMHSAVQALGCMSVMCASFFAWLALSTCRHMPTACQHSGHRCSTLGLPDTPFQSSRPPGLQTAQGHCCQEVAVGHHDECLTVITFQGLRGSAKHNRELFLRVPVTGAMRTSVHKAAERLSMSAPCRARPASRPHSTCVWREERHATHKDSMAPVSMLCTAKSGLSDVSWPEA